MATLTASQSISKSLPKFSTESQFSKSFFQIRPTFRPINSLQVRSGQIKSNAVTRASRRSNSVRAQASGMTIIFIGAECAPWSKTGGLGDVLGGLPPALAALGHRVMVITPRYDQYKDAWDTSVVLELKVGDKTESVRFFHCLKRGVDRVFVDHPLFLEKVWGKTGGKIYGPITGIDYRDNQLRFSLLCKAALEVPRVLNLDSNPYFSGPYGEDVVFVCNDWHTALIPCYLKTMYQPNGLYLNAKVAFCIHNIAYQGRFSFEDFKLLNLPDSFKSSFDFTDGYDKPVKGRKINWLKAGILEADRCITVSPFYAEELLSGADRGVECDNYIRSRGISGIINGMDVNEWNPVTDKFISVNYDSKTVMEGKVLNKEALQAEAGLPVDKGIPLFAFIGRLEEQKGSDILAKAIPQLMTEDIQVIILGTGKKKMEKELEAIEEKFPTKVRAVMKFNAPLAHLIMAGADMLIVPSRFEPCGLIQLQGMQYGTPTVCSSTGGLVNTIIDGKTGFHMGRFDVKCENIDPADVVKIVTTVKRAMKVIGTDLYATMVQNCMAQDLSWKGPAKEWEKFLLSMGTEGTEGIEDGDEIAPLEKENIATP